MAAQCEVSFQAPMGAYVRILGTEVRGKIVGYATYLSDDGMMQPGTIVRLDKGFYPRYHRQGRQPQPVPSEENIWISQVCVHADQVEVIGAEELALAGKFGDEYAPNHKFEAVWAKHLAAARTHDE